MSTKDITSFYDKFLEILTSNKYDCNFWILQMEFGETAIKFNAISKTSLCQKRSKILGRCHLLWLLLSTWALVVMKTIGPVHFWCIERRMEKSVWHLKSCYWHCNHVLLISMWFKDVSREVKYTHFIEMPFSSKT